MLNNPQASASHAAAAACDAEIAERAENLLLPLKGKLGSVQKVSSLISELRHPNTDWKSVISGLRSYLFDHLHDIAGYSGSILPVVFHYLRLGTVRGKGSALRAADTFFDRYSYLLGNGNGNLPGADGIKLLFRDFAGEYLALLMDLSREGMYFGHVNEMARRAGALILEKEPGNDFIARGIARFIGEQYRLYVGGCITADRKEIDELTAALDFPGAEEIAELLAGVTGEAYRERRVLLEKDADGTGIFSGGGGSADFSHNARVWEEICRRMKRAVEDGLLSGGAAELALAGYLIEKSAQGSDRELQLFISRSVASLCSVISRRDDPEIMRSVIDMVMPRLFGEIERGGNYQAAFTSIYNIGRTVAESGRVYLIDHFIDYLVRFRFRFPEFSGIAQDWSVIVNSSHLENIRTWMRLIEINPPLMKKLAASLIVNLKLGGVFLKDTDVFQRDISRLLNSGYRDVFYLVTSLAAVFPAFYHDIGATGDIRSFTEKIDTNHRMNDLVHFIRKQVHVESSSGTVFLMQRVMEFWMTGDRGLLKNLVPSEVYESLGDLQALDGLDASEAARVIVEAVRGRFGGEKEELFWDFLNRVSGEDFLEFARVADIPGLDPHERESAIALIRDYFEKKSPTEMMKILCHLREHSGVDGGGTAIWKFLYEVSDGDFRKLCDKAEKSGISRVNVEKFLHFLHVYRLLYDKYNFSDVRMIDRLEDCSKSGLFNPPGFFFAALRGNDAAAGLEALLSMQLSLKNDILLSPDVFEPLDTIEFKRHIAFGIPSMYGSYKERKFDTLRVFFQMNIIRASFFERMLREMEIPDGKSLDYPGIKKALRLFLRAFIIDGLANQEMITVISLLEAPNLTLSRVRDMVNHLLVIHGEVSDHFNETFKFVCREAIKSIGVERISDRFQGSGRNGGDMEIIVDRFLRDQITQSPLLQIFDNLLVGLRDRLSRLMEEDAGDVRLNRRRRKDSKGLLAIPINDGRPKLDDGTCAPVWEVGGKAHGLMFASRLEGITVPDGYIISSDFYKRIRDGNIRNPRFRRKLTHLLKKYVDDFSHGRFGEPPDPALLSVRSGAVFSMPGVMDTITNVGITDEVLDAMSRIDSWFAYDCYRRLIQDFGISSYGIDRSVFENLMASAKADAGVDLKEKLTGSQMKLLTRKYRYVINEYGHSIPKDPYDQLFYAVLAVFESWDSEIARNYRRFVNLSDDWGTAVIVQRMVFGNISPSDITGVVHSQYLGREKLSLFGEYKTRAQGHDIVSGVARVFPISEEQKKIYAKSAEFPSLETAFPAHYSALSAAVKKIRDGWGNDVEIEFTFEGNTLFILQVRGMTRHVFAVDELDEEPAFLINSLLGQGLAASGGAVSGRAVFRIDRIDLLRAEHPGDKIILIRPETNPEDVIGLKKSDGILTCVGGMTSHAVLQMRRLEKSGVSDFSPMKIDEVKNEARVAVPSREGGFAFIREGEFITIDGTTGNVYLGYHKTRPAGHGD